MGKVIFRGLVKEHKSDRYYKKVNTWTHFVSLMFGIFSRCDSVTEIVEGMIGCVGKLGHFGLLEVPPKSTGKKKGDLKVHMLIDALQDVGKLVKVTAAKVHDSKFLNDLALNPHSMVVFDSL